jgi:hypothetical protein
MALRNAWLLLLNTVTKIKLTLVMPPRNTNHDSPNMLTDQIHKAYGTIVTAFYLEVFRISLFIFS